MRNGKKGEAFLKKARHREEGNIIDQLGAIIVMGFIFALLLVYAAYVKSVQMKLRIDNVSKEYLYVMEQEGYLSDANLANLVADLEAEEVAVTNGFAGTTFDQVPYGDQVVLTYECEFTNPLFKTFGQDDSMFHIPGFEQMNTYDVWMSATAKW